MKGASRIGGVCSRIAVGLAAQLGSERGVALPVAVTMLFLMGSISAVVVTQATTSGGQAKRDRNVKRAVASADAGIDSAIYRLNKLQPAPASCVVVGSNGRLEIVPASNGWCPPQPEDLGEGAQYTHRVSAAQNVQVNGINMLQRKIVSTGEVGGTVRRVKAIVGATTGNPLIGDYGVVSLTGLELKNQARVDGKVGSNGQISTRSPGTFLCGDAYSYINSFSWRGGRCAGDQDFRAPEQFVLSPVDQKDARTNNSNAQFTGISGWDPSTRSLVMTGNSVTLTGDTYSLCHLELRNDAEIRIGLRLPTQGALRIYIDQPEACPGVSGKGNVGMYQKSKITNQNADPASLVIFMLGSPTESTTAEFHQNFGTDLIKPKVAMVVYAPQSRVELRNDAYIRGALAGKTVDLDQNARLEWDSLVGALTMENMVPLYERQSWVECKRLATGAPDSECS